MSCEPPFIIVDTERAFEEAQRQFEAFVRSLSGVLPPNTDVRHIGATAVPGCLTKGDLDVVIRVPIDHFSDVDAALASRFSRNEGSIRTETFSAFEDASSQPQLGVQLTAIAGPFDVFHLFIEALRQSPRLVEEYNALKVQHNGSDMVAYRTAKDAFVKKVLADCGLPP